MSGFTPSEASLASRIYFIHLFPWPYAVLLYILMGSCCSNLTSVLTFQGLPTCLHN